MKIAKSFFPSLPYTVAGKAVGYALVQPPAVVGLKTCGFRDFQPASVYQRESGETRFASRLASRFVPV